MNKTPIWKNEFKTSYEKERYDEQYKSIDLELRWAAHWASVHGNKSKLAMDVCKELLKKGADVNVKNGNGLTPLHFAASMGRVNLCKLFLKYGADINAKDDYGWTPMHDAAFDNHFHVCEFLMKHGANANEMNNNSKTPSIEQGM